MDDNLKNTDKPQGGNNAKRNNNYNRRRNNNRNTNYYRNNKSNKNEITERSADNGRQPESHSASKSYNGGSRNNNHYNNSKPRYNNNNKNKNYSKPNTAEYTNLNGNKGKEAFGTETASADNSQVPNRNSSRNRNRSNSSKYRNRSNNTECKNFSVNQSNGKKNSPDYSVSGETEFLNRSIKERTSGLYGDAEKDIIKEDRSANAGEFMGGLDEKNSVGEKLPKQKKKAKSANNKNKEKESKTENLENTNRIDGKSESEKPMKSASANSEPVTAKSEKRAKDTNRIKNDFNEVKSKEKDANSKAKNTVAEKSLENKILMENRKKSDTRFWSRMFSLAAIVPVYLALIICNIAMPRSTVSNIEKRNLATFPEFSWSDYWSGAYTSNITHYFDDTVPFRDTLKQVGSQLLNFLGIKYNNVQVSGQMQIVNSSTKEENNVNGKNNTSKTSSDVTADASSKTENTDTDKEKQKGQEIADGVYTNGTLVVYQDNHYRAMSMYGGGTGDAYVDAVNSFAKDLRGVRVYSMIEPTTSEFYTPEEFAEYNASQSDDIESINSRLNGVVGINVCPTLAEHTNEPIYTRTDHHWMSLGAYYAAQRFAEEAGVSFKDIRDYEKKSVPGYVGTLYSFSDNNANLLNDPEDFVYYVPKVKNYKVEYFDYSYNFVYEGDMFAETASMSEMYSTYICGDAYTVKITTGVKNGRKLCVVKDSYTNAVIPFLHGSFEEIYVVDMRYFQLNLVDFVKSKGVTDLLFACCSYSAVGTNADNLEVLRTMGGSSALDNASGVSGTSSNLSTEESSESDNEDPLNQEDNEEGSSDEDNNSFFDDIVTDDGQLGIVGNIYDSEDIGANDYEGEDYDDYYDY